MKRMLFVCLLVLTLIAPSALAYSWTEIHGGAFESVHSVTRADGRRMLFALDLPGNLTAFDEHPGGLWAPTFVGHPQSGPIKGRITVVPENNGFVTVFVLGHDNTIHSISHDPASGFTPWTNILPIEVDNYTVARNEDGRIELYSMEKNRRMLWRRIQSFVGANTYIDPVLLAGDTSVMRPILAATRHHDGKLQLFVVMQDGFVYGRKQTLPNQGQYDPQWTPHGSPETPDVQDLQLTTQFNRVTLFMLFGWWHGVAHRQEDANGGMLPVVHNWGHSLQIPFRAVTSADQRLHLFVIGGNSRIYMMEEFTPGLWNNWSEPGLLAKSIDVEPLANATGNIDIFAVDTFGRLMHGRE